MNSAQKRVADLITEAIRDTDERNADSVKKLGTRLENLGALLRDLADVEKRSVQMVSVGTQVNLAGSSRLIPQDSNSNSDQRSRQTPIRNRCCEFCRQPGHTPEKCSMPASTRIQILKMRGACLKCCLIHGAGKCPETRQMCNTCRGWPKHLKWLCPSV